MRSDGFVTSFHAEAPEGVARAEYCTWWRCAVRMGAYSIHKCWMILDEISVLAWCDGHVQNQAKSIDGFLGQKRSQAESTSSAYNDSSDFDNGPWQSCNSNGAQT